MWGQDSDGLYSRLVSGGGPISTLVALDAVFEFIRELVNRLGCS